METPYKDLHNNLDILVAMFVTETRKLPSEATVLELMEWAFTKIEAQPTD